ncbi:hypothetical protein ACFYQ5_05490 [Streptomyces sp. NPDC005794]|uniref:hypothetical protein n=1 Tax=Streptomyces sp. NPDC005794 TaxID=3364733 RepID=UPI0036C831E7
MNSFSKTAAGEPPVRRRRMPVAVVVLSVLLACAAATIGVVSCVTEKVSSDLMDKEITCCWEDGATPAWMSDQMGIRIPDTASDRRAGYEVGERYDTGLLSFVLPADEAETYTGRFVEDGTRMIDNSHPKPKDYRPAAAFDHLGLPAPETFVKGCGRPACARTTSRPRRARTSNAASISSPTSSHPAPCGSTSVRPSSRP